MSVTGARYENENVLHKTQKATLVLFGSSERSALFLHLNVLRSLGK